METYTLIVLTLAATIRVATPLVLAALGAMFSERSGVVALGLEGMMLGAAFASAAVSAVSGSAWLGLGAGIATAVALALLIAFATVTHRGNQVVAAVALNIMVAGLGPTLALAWFNLGGQTPQLDQPHQRFLEIAWPWSHAAREHPFPGLLYAELLSGHNLIVYLTAALVPLSAWVLYRTRFGLRLRAVGENPLAVDTAGISVNGLRYLAVVICGALCGVAGTYLATAASAGFTRDMTAGKGYLALAALIFGKWKPGPTLGACLLFAFTDAVAVRLQGQALSGAFILGAVVCLSLVIVVCLILAIVGAANNSDRLKKNGFILGLIVLLGMMYWFLKWNASSKFLLGPHVIPVQFILALPYVLTVLLLAGFVGKAVAPAAIGVPYSKEK